jgi:hypothetical protein
MSETEEVLIKGKDFTERDKCGLAEIFVVLDIKYYRIKRNYNWVIRRKSYWR